MLDTCALIWWALDPDQLSPIATEACRRMEQEGGFVSSISIWEIGIKIKKKKLEIGLPIEEFVSRIRKSGALEIVPVDVDIWLENLRLVWDNADPADRTIVATANLRRLSIVTADESIRAFHSAAIW